MDLPGPDDVRAAHPFTVTWRGDDGDGREWFLSCPCGILRVPVTSGQLPLLMKIHLEALAVGIPHA